MACNTSSDKPNVKNNTPSAVVESEPQLRICKCCKSRKRPKFYLELFPKDGSITQNKTHFDLRRLGFGGQNEPLSICIHKDIRRQNTLNYVEFQGKRSQNRHKRVGFDKSQSIDKQPNDPLSIWDVKAL